MIHSQHPARSRQVTLVTDTFWPDVNGVANTLQHLCEGLAARDYSVTVVRPSLGNGADPSGAEYRGTEQKTHQEIIVPGIALPGYPGLRLGLPAGRMLNRLWREKPPGTVYLATPGPLGWSARQAATALGIRTYGGYHTNFESYSRHYGFGFLENLIKLYLRDFHNRCAGTLVPTHGIKARIEAYGIERVSVWSRGVDCERFGPGRRCSVLREEWGLDDTDLAVLYVGRIAAEKNLMQAVSTFERLRGIHPRARFILVGDGPLRQRLQARHPDYLFRGQRRGDDLARHFASGDLLLFPSKTDTFGNVVIEAMASGLAVVAFDDGAAAEYIEDSATGMKVAFSKTGGARESSRNMDETFTRSALRLADQPSLRRRIGTRARDKALTLRWFHLIEQFEDMIIRPRTEVYAHADKQGLSTF